MTSPDSIRDKVIAHLIAASDEEVAPENVNDDTSLREDLDLSSLQAVTLVMDLEDEFGVEIQDEEIEALNTVGDVLRLLDSKAAGSS